MAAKPHIFRPDPYPVAGRGARRRPLLRRAVRLRPGGDLRRAARHQGDVLAQRVAGRGGDELGHPGRSAGRARRRRTGGPDRPQAHGADRGRVVHAGRPRASAGTRYGRPGRGAADHRRRGRRGRRRRAALCRRVGTDGRARPFRLRLPARHHHRHLPRLSGRWLAVGEQFLADHAGGGRRAGAAAVRGGAGGAEIAALADEEAAAVPMRPRNCARSARASMSSRASTPSRRLCARRATAPPGARSSRANGDVR